MNNEKNPRIYEFEDYRLDSEERVLERAGEEVPLTPTLFEILLTLVESGGRILDKERFMQRVWSGRVVEDGNLARNISTLRKILGDDPQCPRYIETIPRRGYRFVAAVRSSASGSEALPAVARTVDAAVTAGVAIDRSDSDTRPQAPRRQRSRRSWSSGPALATAGALVLAALLLAPRSDTGTQAVIPPPIRSLIVLPLVNHSGEENEHIADGVAGDLISNLGKLSALTVTSQTSSLHYKGTRKRLPQIAAEVGVDGVVEGALVRAGERVRISIQLVDARTDQVLWTESYEVHEDKVSELQADMVRTIAQRIELAVTPEESRRLAAARPVDFEAYEAYLRGRHFKNRQSVDALHEAIAEFERALANEPDFAPAWSAMADTYLSLASWQGPSTKYWPRARAAARRALDIDANLAEAHLVLAGALLCHDLDQSAAEPHFLKALQLHPNDQMAHHRYGYSLMTQGRFDESIAHMQGAIALDPVSLIHNAVLGRILHVAGRSEEALQQLQRTLALDAHFPQTHRYLGLVHLTMADAEGAVRSLEKAFDLGGGPGVLGELAYAYGIAGRKDEALARLGTLEEWSREGLDTAFSIALAHHGLGDTDQALAWLRKAYDERDFRMILLLVDPIWDDVRDDPGFAELLSQIGLRGHRRY